LNVFYRTPIRFRAASGRRVPPGSPGVQNMSPIFFCEFLLSLLQPWLWHKVGLVPALSLRAWA